ncbi:hypothetical protein GCM10023238_06850 [Streptomyces heliomycini]
MKRKLIAAIGVAGMLFSVAACGGDDGDGGKKAGADGYAGETLTVWVMDGSSPDQWQKDLAAEFEKKTKAKVEFEVQQWNGIQQKLTTALSEENPPDVFEIGNTQTPAYAKTGGLADLADLKRRSAASGPSPSTSRPSSRASSTRRPGTSPTASSSTTRRSGRTRAEGHPQDPRRVLRRPQDHR